MQLLSDYLTGIVTMSNAIKRHQQQADELLKMFNTNLGSVEIVAASIPHNSLRYFFEGAEDKQTIVKEFIQHLAEYHITEVRKLEAQLEDIVKARYLENSH